MADLACSSFYPLCILMYSIIFQSIFCHFSLNEMLEEKVHYADEFIKLKEMLSCRDRMVVRFTLPMQSMHFTPNVKIVSDLWQVGGFLLQGRIRGGGGGEN